MKLCDTLKEDTIVVPLNATDRDSTIEELLNKLVSNNILTTTSMLVEYIKDLENNQSTAAGKGVAYPHSTSIEVTGIQTILGISKSGVDYNAPDKQLCHFILLTLTPQDLPNKHRKFITLFRTMIDDSLIRTMILDSNNNINVLRIINKWDAKQISSDELE